MLNRSDDRRARRSRRLLKQGLTELLGEKRFSDITVRDITERMDLNRGTFYLHYTDTYDLLQSLEEDVLRAAQEMIDAHRSEADGESLRPIFAPILRYIAENREICESLFRSNASNDFIGRIQQLIYENGAGLIRSRYPDAPEERMEYLLRFVAAGLIGLVRHWFSSDMALEQDRLLEIADGLVNGAARELLT